MRDFLGQILKENDMVATNLNGHTSGLVSATVVGFTPKKIILKRQINNLKFYKFPDQVVKTSREHNE